MFLFVEDEAPTRNALLRLTSRIERLALDAADHESARHILASEKVDVVVSGIRNGPGEDGIEFLEWVRTEYPLAARVVLSAMVYIPEKRGRALEVAHALFSKPFDARLVMEALGVISDRVLASAAPVPLDAFPEYRV